jgi:hypothetical protein
VYIRPWNYTPVNNEQDTDHSRSEIIFSNPDRIDTPVISVSTEENKPSADKRSDTIEAVTSAVGQSTTAGQNVSQAGGASGGAAVVGEGEVTLSSDSIVLIDPSLERTSSQITINNGLQD